MSETNNSGTVFPLVPPVEQNGTVPANPAAPVTRRMEITSVLVLPALQSRSGGLDNGRCSQLGFVLKNGGSLPNMKAMEIDDKDHKNHGKVVLYGGFHRMEGHIIADIKEANFDIVKGTWAEAVRAAAMENKEHDTAGRYRSNEDKRKAVLMYCSSYANTPRASWPTDREVARFIGVSHTFVSDMDPFGRGENLTAKDEGGIRDRGEVKRKKKKNGKKKGGIELFDWNTYDQKIAYMARGLDTVSSTYGVPKESPEFKSAVEHLEALTQQFKRWHDAHAKTKPTGTAAAALAAARAEGGKGKKAKGKKAKGKKSEKPKDTTPKDADGFPVTYSDQPAKTPEVTAKA